MTTEVLHANNSVSTIWTSKEWNYLASVPIHFFSNPVPLRRADALRTTCTYDSTGRSNTTKLGSGVGDEMCFSYMLVSGTPDFHNCWHAVAPEQRPREDAEARYSGGCYGICSDLGQHMRFANSRPDLTRSTARPFELPPPHAGADTCASSLHQDKSACQNGVLDYAALGTGEKSHSQLRCLRSVAECSPGGSIFIEYKNHTKWGNDVPRYWLASALARSSGLSIQSSLFENLKHGERAKALQDVSGLDLMAKLYAHGEIRTAAPGRRQSPNGSMLEAACACAHDAKYPHRCGWKDGAYILDDSIVRETYEALLGFPASSRLSAAAVREELTLPAADAVVHFRCASYGILPASYYRKALRQLAPASKIFVVANTGLSSHGIRNSRDPLVRWNQACRWYRDLLATSLGSIVRNAQVQIIDVDAVPSIIGPAAPTSSATRDLLMMAASPLFVGAPSTFSLLAARLHLQRQSFMPEMKGDWKEGRNGTGITWLRAPMLHIIPRRANVSGPSACVMNCASEFSTNLCTDFGCPKFCIRADSNGSAVASCRVKTEGGGRPEVEQWFWSH